MSWNDIPKMLLFFMPQFTWAVERYLRSFLKYLFVDLFNQRRRKKKEEGRRRRGGNNGGGKRDPALKGMNVSHGKGGCNAWLRMIQFAAQWTPPCG